MVLVFSAASNASQHVLREIERAVNKKIPIIAFKIEECTLSKSMQYFLLSNQWLDATAGVSDMLETLSLSIDKIHSIAGKTSEGAPTPANTIRVSNKAVPAVLGVIAVGIMAIAIILAFSAGKGELPVAKNTDITTSTTENFETTISEESVETTSETVETTTAKNEESNIKFDEGEYVQFGRYHPTGYSKDNGDGEIVWQIISVDEATGTLKMISANIIDIKPYDCAESGHFGYDSDGNAHDHTKSSTYTVQQMRDFYGSNDWLSSDLWAWLNSTGTVHYTGLYQSDRSTDENGNAFGTQLGFLSSFKKSELGMICISTPASNMSEMVSILSKEEIEELSYTDFFNLHPPVTKSAIASDSTSWYAAYTNSGAPDYIWVTRTPWDANSCDVYYVESSIGQEKYSTGHSAASGYGIRPVISINLYSVDDSKVDGEGSLIDPYILTD